MADKPTKRQRVQRLEEWDGARYSIIPADAWADENLSLVHHRVLAAIGRVNTQLGWCEFSQTAFAKLVGNSRQAVSEAVNDLVRWRYVEIKRQTKTRSAVCHYRILIDDPIIEAEVEPGKERAAFRRGPRDVGERDGGRHWYGYPLAERMSLVRWGGYPLFTKLLPRLAGCKDKRGQTPVQGWSCLIFAQGKGISWPLTLQAGLAP